ncbi:MAG: hypothetical protein BWY59_01614 [Verrucomicrobia bacterium ADurb.Bin345]|nr:MAG: hypothetical protein BWY59_01614 [Verrucomicrobia bacterium ADurb.Bin345]
MIAVPKTKLAITVLVLSAFLYSGRRVCAFDPEDYEEPGGTSVTLRMSPTDKIYGISFEDGTWLVGTPLMGQFFVSLYRSGEVDSFFGSVGMTFRLIPRWRVAPFIGGGGGYNWAFKGVGNEQTGGEPTAKSHWSSHGEGGVRVWSASRGQFLELSGRGTRNMDDQRLNYWSVALSYGQGW